MIEVRGLFSAVESRGVVAQMAQRVRLKFLMQQLSDDVSHLLHREARGRFFPPPLFLRQKPCRYQGERLMMMPPSPYPVLPRPELGLV
jgi:hypothetical protein